MAYVFLMDGFLRKIVGKAFAGHYVFGAGFC